LLVVQLKHYTEHRGANMIFANMKSRMNQLKTLRTSSLESSVEAETEKRLPFYVGVMTKLADCERCSIFIHDPAQSRVWLKAGTGVTEREIEVPKEGSIVGEVIATGKHKIINSMETRSGVHKQVDDKTGFITRNILCVPIKSAARGEASGAIELLNKIDDRDFSDKDLALAEEIAGHLKKEVDAIFMDQELFGFTESLFKNGNIAPNGVT